MELEWYLFGFIFLLGAGYVFWYDWYVRVDLFYVKFLVKDKVLVNFIGGLIFLIFWIVILIYVFFEYVIIVYKIGEGLFDFGGFLAWYIIKFVIIVGMVLFFL